MLHVHVLIAAIIVTVLHILGEEFEEHVVHAHGKILNIGTGLLVGVFFVEILPEIVAGEELLGGFLYLFLLLGFLAIHTVESRVYKLHDKKEQIEHDRLHFEAGGLAAYNAIVGFITVIFFQSYGSYAFLMLIPFYLRTFSIAMFSEVIFEDIEKSWQRAVEITPLIASVIGLVLIRQEIVFYAVFAMAGGVLAYVMIREMIPMREKNHLSWFIVGVLISITYYLYFLF